MPYFAVTLIHGSAYDSSKDLREQASWDEHAAFMDALVSDNFVIVGGPLFDTDRALLLVQADDENEIRRRLAADPWEPMDILRIGDIEPWTIWLGKPRLS